MGWKGRGLGQKLHRRGLNKWLTKDACTSHFFSFQTTAIDQGMTSVNQPQCFDPSINVPISKPNCDLSKPAPTSQNQPEPSANISKPTSDNVSKPTNGDARTQRQHLETNGDTSKPTSTSRNPPPRPQRQHVQPRTQHQHVEHGDTNLADDSRPTPISQTQRQHLEPNANMSTMRIWTRPVSLVNGRIRFGRERMGRRNCITALMISITLPVSLLGLKEYICKYTIVIFFLFLVTHSLFQAMYEAMKCQYLCTPDIISCKTALQMFRQSTFDWYINVTIEFCVVSRAWKYTQFIAWTFAWLRTMNARLLLD